MSEPEQKASMNEFFAYEALLRKNGHLVGGEGLRGAQQAATLRFQNGKVSVTDGPYAETKEQLAGFFVIEAKDITEAIQLMSKHPVVRGGPIEIRPAADPVEMARLRDQWRAANPWLDDRQQ
jgi:hypothetical protein